MIDIRQGDCVELMRAMPANSVDSIVTDPPYELGFMGKSWDSTGIANSVRMWDEALRVLKPGGYLLSFGGSRTYHRMACAIEDAGFEIRDQIMWVYGSGFPKSLDVSKAIDKQAGVKREVLSETLKRSTFDLEQNGGGGFQRGTIQTTSPTTDKAKQWQGWGTALKPAHEPIVMARKPLSESTVASNVLKHGTGGINIDGSRIEGAPPSVPQPSLRPKGEDSGHALGTGEGRNGEMSQAIGRWPANFIHDGSDEVLELFPLLKGKIGMSGNTGGNNQIYGKFNRQEDRTSGITDSGSAARFFYCAKTSKKDRNEGLDGFAGKETGDKGNGLARSCATCGASTLEGCDCPDRTYVKPTRANHHPTVKPTDLMRYLIKLVTPPNGTVLDPFTGSGSTGKAAVLEGFNFIGCELDPDYIAIANARISHALEQQQGKLL